MRFLGLMRVQADSDQNEVAQIFGTLAKKKNVVVPGRVGLEPQMGLQCRVFPPYQIQPGYLRDNISRRLIITRANLILFRIQILFLIRNGRRLGNLEARIHTP